MKANRLCLLLLFLAGCGAASSAPAPTPTSRAQGKVAIDESGRGNASTTLFQINPFKPWGVAFTYACGTHPGTFDGVVFESMVAAELPYTAFSAHGTHGRGLKMETGSTSNITAPNGSQAGNILSLHITTACAWHVRVIAGTRAAVQRAIPTHA